VLKVSDCRGGGQGDCKSSLGRFYHLETTHTTDDKFLIKVCTEDNSTLFLGEVHQCKLGADAEAEAIRMDILGRMRKRTAEEKAELEHLQPRVPAGKADVKPDKRTRAALVVVVTGQGYLMF
jgi:hypothetical protein